MAKKARRFDKFSAVRGEILAQKALLFGQALRIGYHTVFLGEESDVRRVWCNRIAAVFLSVVLLWGIMPVSATDPTATDALRARLWESLASSAAVIDLSDLSVTPAALREIYLAVLQDDPALFYVAPRLSYAVSGDGTRATAVYPAYAVAGEELVSAQALYRDTVAGLADEVEEAFAEHPRTDAEAVLLVHELLAERYDYDMRGMEGAGGNIDAYTLFRDGVGVCQAYAMAAIAVLRTLGMEADLVTSAVMDHAWVHVRVGELWYHVDVTRDDPVTSLPNGTPGGASGSAGLVTHTRVLRSDAGMRALGYRDYSCAGGHVCADGRYENSAAMAALGEMTAPLRPVSVGKGSGLVWLGENARGEVCPLLVTEEGIALDEPWDIDGDGAVTLGDLLLVSDDTLPQAWKARLRKQLIERREE